MLTVKKLWSMLFNIALHDIISLEIVILFMIFLIYIQNLVNSLQDERRAGIRLSTPANKTAEVKS